MLVIPEKRKIVINSTANAAVAQYIPHAKPFTHEGQQLVALDYGVDEALVLKNLGFHVTPPILHYYDWPGRFAPMNHQKETAAFLTTHKRSLCLNAPGTGKSISSLWAADFLLSEGVARKVLIVAPLSTLKVVWGRELRHHLPHRSFVICTGAKQKRRDLLETPGVQYVIINHDGFTTMQEYLKDFDVVIYDEATALKSPSSQRYKIFAKWVQTHQPWLWLLTGTPISQTPADAWTLARLVDSPNVPRSFTTFKDLVMQKVTQFKWVPRSDALETCRKVLQPSIRFSLDECKDLPETNYVGRKTELTAQQTKAFKEMKDKAVTVFAAGEVTAANAAVMLSKLLQISCIAHNTDVLTDEGWMPIQNVRAPHKVWDGVEWVAQGGAVYRGAKSLVEVDGVRMTADHQVWVGKWVTAQEIIDGNAGGGFDRAAVRLPDGFAESPRNSARKTTQVQVATDAGFDRTYDLINCGPRNRFVVRGVAGRALIVHNCGVVYGDTGTIAIDGSERHNTLTELLEEIGDKAIIFVPLRGVQDWLEQKLKADGIDVASVHGSVSKADRDQIFHDFQHTDQPKVLLAHPKVAAHGLTLTRARDIIWFAPIYSLEQYEQANARIRRLTTQGKTTVWHIWATPFEAELYRRLRAKQNTLAEFLALVQGVNSDE